MNDSETTKSRGMGRVVLVVIGLLLLCALPFLPWLSRGMNQRAAAASVKAAGGIASYGKRMSPDGDFYTDSKGQTADGGRRKKTMIDDLFGEPFVEQLTQVELRKPGDRSLVPRLRKLPYLLILDASGANFTDDDLAQFSSHTDLEKFWINNSQVTNDGLSALSEMQNLVSLSVEGTSLDDQAIDTISQLKALKRLYLKDTKITNAGVAKLTELTNLLGIGLEGTSVSDAGVEQLANIPTLTEVRLSATKVTDSGASSLGKLKELQSVYLDDTELTTAGVSWLADCDQLEIVDLSGTKVTDGVIEVIGLMPKIVSVDLRGTSLSENAIDELRGKLRGREQVTVQSEFSELATQ